MTSTKPISLDFSQKFKTGNLTAREIIDSTHAYIKSLGIDISSLREERYRHFVRSCLSEYRLEERELRKLSEHLGIEWLTRDATIPHSYVASISFEHLGTKYEHPDNVQEFTIFASAKSKFGKCVLKHTQNGYQDISYFTDLVPHLEVVWNKYQEELKKRKNPPNSNLAKKDAILGNVLEQTVNAPLNDYYKTKDKWSIDKLQTVHHFFNQYLPVIEGICPHCFNVSLPREGFGARWFINGKQHHEIRLSVPKLNSNYDSHRVLYVTHTYQSLDKRLYVTFEGVHYLQRNNQRGERIESCLQVSRERSFNQISKETHKDPDREASAHIPYDIYQNFLHILCRVPNITNREFTICQCQKLI